MHYLPHLFSLPLFVDRYHYMEIVNKNKILTIMGKRWNNLDLKGVLSMAHE